jgi:hypothetical protein
LVKGLEIFREHFRDYADRYVLIGGAACDIAMTGAGLAFRATKDLDILLYVEALDAAFVRAFWEFVRAGGYEVQEKSTGEKQFYRFQKPTNPDDRIGLVIKDVVGAFGFAASDELTPNNNASLGEVDLATSASSRPSPRVSLRGR